MTPTEQFVFDLSQAACLKLWTYANPCKSNDRKELCDVLVVCQPDVVIFSVKNVALRQDGDPAVQLKRWQRRAIDASLDDIGSAAFRADLASARHETQYTRLFRS